jgi:D-sorbitol dehydrogenase (acceptor)
VFAVNVKALFFLLQAAARVMKESGGGRIVNVSSPAARLTMNNKGSHATVAEGIVWLATQSTSYVTANRLNISGGLESD